MREVCHAPRDQSVQDWLEDWPESNTKLAFGSGSPARLIDKGLLYTTSHGYGDFTVPQFDRYMRRNHDLAPPPARP